MLLNCLNYNHKFMYLTSQALQTSSYTIKQLPKIRKSKCMYLANQMFFCILSEANKFSSFSLVNHLSCFKSNEADILNGFKQYTCSVGDTGPGNRERSTNLSLITLVNPDAAF